MNLFIISIIYLAIGFLVGLAYIAYEIFTTGATEDTYCVDYDSLIICAFFWPLALTLGVVMVVFKGITTLTDLFVKKVIGFKKKIDSGEFEAERNAKKEAKSEATKKKNTKKKNTKKNN